MDDRRDLLPRPPSTKHQILALLLDLGARHAGTKPPLTMLSRALWRTDAFAHEVLRQLRDRDGGPRRWKLATETDFRPVLRWLLPPDDRRKPRDPWPRFIKLSHPKASARDLCEAFLCAHVALASAGAEERGVFVDFVAGQIVEAPMDTGYIHWLRGMLLHGIVDFGADAVKQLLTPTVSRKYEPADHLFNLAVALETSRSSDLVVKARLADLRGESPPAFVLAASLLVVRLGALPDLAERARSYLSHLDDRHGDLLRHAPLVRCAAYAGRCHGYGAEWGEVMAGRRVSEADVIPLLEAALSLVGRGAVRRRKRGGDDGFWSEIEARHIARRFTAWGFAHECCALFLPALDQRRGDTVLAKQLAALASWICATPLHRSFGDMVIDDFEVRKVGFSED